MGEERKKKMAKSHSEVDRHLTRGNVGVKGLARAVIIRAISDYIRPDVPLGGRDGFYIDKYLEKITKISDAGQEYTVFQRVNVDDSAREFFEGNPQSLEDWCEKAGFDADKVRNSVIRLKQSGVIHTELWQAVNRG